jgi:outer membrane protein assembly factor BamE
MRIRISAIMLLASILTLPGCFFKPYRVPVEQGNIINLQMVQSLKIGMTRTEVVSILGNPVLSDGMDAQIWNYAYTSSPGKGPQTKKLLTIEFSGDRVIRFKEVHS